MIYYILMINIVAFLLMGIDKYKAAHHRYRISENTLFFFALIGGSIGILLGMFCFRHKIRKMKFKVGIPLMIVVQLILIKMIAIG